MRPLSSACRRPALARQSTSAHPRRRPYQLTTAVRAGRCPPAAAFTVLHSKVEHCGEVILRQRRRICNTLNSRSTNLRPRRSRRRISSRLHPAWRMQTRRSRRTSARLGNCHGAGASLLRLSCWLSPRGLASCTNRRAGPTDDLHRRRLRQRPCHICGVPDPRSSGSRAG
jgi:hypothetical protein